MKSLLIVVLWLQIRRLSVGFPVGAAPTSSNLAMPLLPSRLLLVLLSSTLAVAATACSLSSRSATESSNFNASSPDSSGTVQVSTAQPSLNNSLPANRPAEQGSTAAPAAPQADPFLQAIERATGAFNISRSAQSQDDWRLVANRWQQAIDLMAAVPVSSPHHRQAVQKLAEYRRNLAFAQQQSNRSSTLDNPTGRALVRQQANPPLPPLSPIAARPVLPPASQPAPALAQPSHPGGGKTFFAPIVRRAGSTPVISVTFNGSQKFEMIVDTGASGTLITRNMASALGVVPIAETSVDTASQQNVSLPLGYVNSIEVGGATANHVLVAVAGPDLSIGLLGHDFFGNYDITIRQNEVEFQERS